MPIKVIAFVSLAAFFVLCFCSTATPVVPYTMNWNVVYIWGNCAVGFGVLSGEGREMRIYSYRP